MPKKRNRKVGPSVVQNYEFLKSIAKTKSSKKRAKLLGNADQQQLASVVEVAHNMLALDKSSGKPHYYLTNRQRRKLIPFAPYIRRISRARTESGVRRHLQKGGSLGLLVPLLIPVIKEVAKSLLSSNGS